VLVVMPRAYNHQFLSATHGSYFIRGTRARNDALYRARVPTASPTPHPLVVKAALAIALSPEVQGAIDTHAERIAAELDVPVECAAAAIADRLGTPLREDVARTLIVRAQMRPWAHGLRPTAVRRAVATLLGYGSHQAVERRFALVGGMRLGAGAMTATELAQHIDALEHRAQT